MFVLPRSRSLVVELVRFSSIKAVLPVWKVTVPLVAVSVPIERPGATMDPELATKLPRIEPVPFKVWPLANDSVLSARPSTSIVAVTVILEQTRIDPLFVSANVPLLTSVLPRKVLEALKNNGLPPVTFDSTPVPLMTLVKCIHTPAISKRLLPTRIMGPPKVLLPLLLFMVAPFWSTQTLLSTFDT